MSLVYGLPRSIPNYSDGTREGITPVFRSWASGVVGQGGLLSPLDFENILLNVLIILVLINKWLMKLSK